ncbi:MAG: NAD(P)/FAD-dependent oxidoreductase [Bacteroidota bacterium]
MGTNIFDYQVAIIGAGFGGLAMGIRLKKAGKGDFVILEKASEVGGTWRDNTYPGCACDIPSHLYSFSFELNPNWSRQFSPQPEILTYLKSCTEKYNLYEHIQFNSGVEKMRFDKEKGGWEIQIVDGKTVLAQSVVLATGPLNRVNIPNIPGKDSFKGPAFHSSEWDSSVELAGKRVAVIGTGASAIQLVPQIAKEAKQVYVFQRTPPWVIPKPDRKVYKFEQMLYKTFPALQRLHRNWIFFRLDALVGGFLGNKFLNNFTRKVATKHIQKSISDPALQEKVTPAYAPGCKRILVSNDYYPTLELEHVELIPEAVSQMEESILHTATGTSHEVDVVVYATGFDVAETFTFVKIFGKEEVELQDLWDEAGIAAYKGTTVAGFPHLFMLLGPNTGLGHNSVVHIEESQITYILECLDHIQGLDTGYWDLKSEVQLQYNTQLQERLIPTVWQSGGCVSWYQNSQGKNPTIWPGSNRAFRKETSRVEVGDYLHIKREEKVGLGKA